MLKTYKSTRIECGDDIVVVETEQTDADYIESLRLTVNGKESRIVRATVGGLIEALRDHS